MRRLVTRAVGAAPLEAMERIAGELVAAVAGGRRYAANVGGALIAYDGRVGRKRRPGAAAPDGAAGERDAGDHKRQPRPGGRRDPLAEKHEHNWALLSRLDELVSLGRPLLVGASRKSFLGALLAADGSPRDSDGRDAASAALTTVAALAGVWAVRVHEVRASVDAVRVAAALTAARNAPATSCGAR